MALPAGLSAGGSAEQLIPDSSSMPSNRRSMTESQFIKADRQFRRLEHDDFR